MLHLRTLGQLDRVQIIAAVTLLVSFFKDSIKDWLWKIYEETGKLWSPFVDHYKPQDGLTTILLSLSQARNLSLTPARHLWGWDWQSCASHPLWKACCFLNSNKRKKNFNYAIDAVSEGISSNFAAAFQQYASITE